MIRLPQIVSCAFVLTAFTASAADRTWNTLGPSNTWDTATLNWTSILVLPAAWSDGDDATFSGLGGESITLNSNVSANSLSFTGNGYSITGSGTLTLSGAAGISVSSGVSATLGTTLAGSSGLAKSGTGTLVLSGSNSYSGTTSVTAGTLRVNGSLANTSVNVGASGVLDGSGSVAGPLAVSGRLAPGAAAIESFATGSLTLNTGSTLGMELQSTSATGADLLSVTGNLTLNGLVTLELSKIGGTGWSQSDKLTLVSYSGSWNGGLLSVGGQAVADDSQFTFDGQTWVLNYNDTTKGANYASDATGGTYVTMTAVPEPGAAVLGGLGLFALLRRRRSA